MDALDKLALEDKDFFSDVRASDQLVAQMLMLASRILPAVAEVNNRRTVDLIKCEDVKDFLENQSKYSDYITRRVSK